MVVFAALLRRDPLDADLLYQYGKALTDGGDYAGAARVFQAHLTLKPEHLTAWSRLAFALYRSDELDAAQAVYQRILATRGPYAPALAPLAQLRYLAGDPEEGARLMATVADAPTIDPESAVVQALYALQCGDYRRGFAGIEARWRMEQFDHPAWVGDPDRHWSTGPRPPGPLVVHAEEGFGDVIMMSRFVPRLLETGGDITFLVPPALERLMGTLSPGVRVVSDAGRLPAGARNAGLMSLPFLLSEDGSSLWPGGHQYLSSPDSAPVLDRPDTLRVGLVWAGGGGTVHDRDRSMPHFDVLRPLLGLPGISWFSLQVGPRAAECQESPVVPAPALRDFAETGALVGALDLVISVDTAVCHLAGALGVPTWVLVPTVPEWRWMAARETTPWYPSTRVFRRQRSSDWPGVLDAVAAALQRQPRPER